mmetsp:Transcript_107286/g.268991  ORF Transcript_107286/g.268991 Transcript_107286/m.268991 type:complete len:93 (-) Transcript_107286:8-286(-)
MSRSSLCSWVLERMERRPWTCIMSAESCLRTDLCSRLRSAAARCGRQVEPLHDHCSEIRAERRKALTLSRAKWHRLATAMGGLDSRLEGLCA